MAYNTNTDYSTILRDLINSGASANEVSGALASRNEKIGSDSSLSQYANDEISRAAQTYINNTATAPVIGGGIANIGSIGGMGSQTPSNSTSPFTTLPLKGYEETGIYDPKSNVSPATPKTPTTPSINPYQDYYDKLYEAQRRQQIAALQSAFESATGGLKTSLNSNLAGLDTAQAGIGDAYQVKRNQTAAQSDVSAMNFAQYMAARGIKGSAGGMPEIYRNSALQGSLGALNQAEARENADIDRQRATLRENFNTQLDTLNNKFLSDSTAVGAQIDAAATKSKIDAMKEDSAKATAQTAADKEAFKDTLGAYSENYQAEIDRIQALVNAGDSSQAWKIPYLKAARQSKIASQEQAQSAANQQGFENWLAEQKLEQSRQSASSGGSGGSSSSSTKTPTYAQIDGDMQDIFALNTDANGRLTDAGKSALYNYAMTYGGAYANQLIAKYGLTGGTGGGTPKGGGYNSVYNEAYTSMGEPGTTQDDIANYLKSQYEQGNVTREEVLDIAGRLNLNIS